MIFLPHWMRSRRFVGSMRASAAGAPVPGDSEYRDALAELVDDGESNGFTWRIPRCPFCGEVHHHGGGIVGQDDPRDLLSWRVPHCFGGPKRHLSSCARLRSGRYRPQCTCPEIKGACYQLVDSDPARTARIMLNAGYLDGKPWIDPWIKVR